MDAQWIADPTGAHDLRYWDGTKWTEHVTDGGVTSTDFLPADAPPPPPPGASAPPPPPPVAPAIDDPLAGTPLVAEADLAAAPPPDAPAAAPPVDAPAADPAPTGKGGWKDKLKAAAQTAAQQGKQLADQAKTAVAEQQQKKVEQWQNDPNTLWFGQSKNPATGATGISKAWYRITKDRIWIDSGMLGVKSDQVPLWAVKDIDVRQSMLQRGKDVGDVVLWLEDPTLAADPTGMMSMSGASEPGAKTSGEVLLDNIEGPYEVRDLLMPLVSEARQKKLMERQSQFVHHMNPPGYGMQPTPAPAPPPAAASGGPSDLAGQLRELAQLRDDGILSEEEFAAQKARLLGG